MHSMITTGSARVDRPLNDEREGSASGLDPAIVDPSGCRDRADVWVIGSTFVAEPALAPIEEVLCAPLSCRTQLVQYAQLFQYLMDPMSFAGEGSRIVGSLLFFRVEDFLRHASSDRFDPTDAGQNAVRAFLHPYIGEAVASIGSASRSAPVYVVICPSHGWIASKRKLVELCRTFSNLLTARLSGLEDVHLIDWNKAALAFRAHCPDQSMDNRGSDRLGHVPYTDEFYQVLGRLAAVSAVWSMSDRWDIARHEACSLPAALAEFYKRLGVTLVVKRAQISDTEQIGHLMNTVGAFNLSGVVKDPATIRAELGSTGVEYWLIDVADQMGAYGTAGFFTLQCTADEARVESFLLTCPVLGKQVEFGAIVALAKIVSGRGIPVVRFVPRQKQRNEPILKFLVSLTGIADRPPMQDVLFTIRELGARIRLAAPCLDAVQASVEDPRHPLHS